MTPSPVKIGSIVIDCDDFDRMLGFWRGALHYVPREPPTDGWVVLRDPKGRGPNVSLNRTSEGHLEPYRLHLDLYTDRQAEEVRRLVGLGATKHRDPHPGEDFVVLADPDGNLFCVVDTSGR
jgi:catechol 2,3-dioxygenase-like lactoylglutathione lyase family enzyme